MQHESPNDYTHAVLMSRIKTNLQRLSDNIAELTRHIQEINCETVDLRRVAAYWQTYMDNVTLMLEQINYMADNER